MSKPYPIPSEAVGDFPALPFSVEGAWYVENNTRNAACFCPAFRILLIAIVLACFLVW